MRREAAGACGGAAGGGGGAAAGGAGAAGLGGGAAGGGGGAAGGGGAGGAHRCSWCGRAFAERWALLKHARTHSGERPFRCPHCPRAFADCSNLNKHKKVTARPGEQSSDTLGRFSLLQPKHIYERRFPYVGDVRIQGIAIYPTDVVRNN